MKKLFLTSGLILCMTCPAFAATDINPNGTSAANGTTTANCTYTYLDSYTGPVNLEAKWNAICYAGGVTLDSKKYSSSSDANGTAATTSASPTPIYIKYDTGMFTNNTCTTRQTNNSVDDKLTTVPALTGYTFGGFYNDKASATAASPAAANQMIDNTGVLTAYGRTNSSLSNTAGTASTWYARYTANPQDVTWSCGEATGDVTGAPASWTYDGSYTMPSTATGCVAPNGKHFGGWECSYDPATGTNISPNTSTVLVATCGNTCGTNGTINICTNSHTGTFKGTSALTCTAKWDANTVCEIKFYRNYPNDQQPVEVTGTNTDSCTYGGVLNLPTAPTRYGYTFQGWCVQGHCPGDQ